LAASALSGAFIGAIIAAVVALAVCARADSPGYGFTYPAASIRTALGRITAAAGAMCPDTIGTGARAGAARRRPCNDRSGQEKEMGRLLHRREVREIFGFIPKYELAVMRRMDVTRMICTFHYRDKRAFDWIACAIIEDGIYGKAIQELLQSVPGDIRGTWMSSMQPMMKDEPVEISEDERTEFSKRLEAYEKSYP